MLIAFMLFIATTAMAQITLAHTYQAISGYGNLTYVRLTSSGDKYALYDNLNNQVKLYNLNHSIWKTLNLTVTPGYTLLGLYNISDGLFNTDSSIELFYTYWAYTTTNTPMTYTSEARVIDENLTTLLTIPQCRSGSIVKMGNGYKLFANIDSLNKAKVATHNVYDLVGSLPIVTNVSGEIESGSISQPYPNPSSDKTIIGYELPEGVDNGEVVIYDINGSEIKKYTIDRSFNTLELDNSDLISGTYFYKLIAQGVNGSKKMVIIK